MKLYNKIGAAVAIVSVATVLGASGKLLYENRKADSYSNQIQLLENYSENPDQNKLAELRQEVADSNVSAWQSVTVCAGAAIPCIGGLNLAFYVPGRRKESKLEAKAASS